jgi:hypothetical protein
MVWSPSTSGRTGHHGHPEWETRRGPAVGRRRAFRSGSLFKRTYRRAPPDGGPRPLLGRERLHEVAGQLDPCRSMASVLITRGLTKPLSGRPVKSIGRTCGSPSARWARTTPSRSTSSSRMMPQHMWPLTMNERPPNIVRSAAGTVSASSSLTRAARRSSYATYRPTFRSC